MCKPVGRAAQASWCCCRAHLSCVYSCACANLCLSHSNDRNPCSSIAFALKMNSLLPSSSSSPVQSTVALITQQFQNLGRHARNVPLSSLTTHHRHQPQPPSPSSPPPVTTKEPCLSESLVRAQQLESEDQDDSSAHHYQNDIVTHRGESSTNLPASRNQLEDYYNRYMSDRHRHHHQQQLPPIVPILGKNSTSPQYQNELYQSSREYQNAVQVQQYQQQAQIEQQQRELQRVLEFQQLEEQKQQQKLQLQQQNGQQPASDNLVFLPRLLEDLGKLAEDRDSADLVFIVGQEEKPIYAHRLIMRARCSNFKQALPGEICNIPSVAITPASGSTRSIIRWPQATEEAVADVLHYIYTGQVRISEQTLLQTLMVSLALGLEQLSTFGEEYLKLTVSISNACAYLDETLSLKPYLLEADGTRLLMHCMNFISEHSPECIHTAAFESLSKEGITYLVSSDYFSLDEADIFRCVLAWAKHQTGVHKPPSSWDDDERSRIAQKLSGVINHVRILQIDSQVFAEEMEPTGVIPIELSLASYRFAALSSKQQTAAAATASIFSDAALLRPRRRAHSRRFFARSRLLEGKPELEETLNAWFGSPNQRWHLLFRASEHAFSAAAFHAHCDGHAPTYVLVTGSQAHLAGAFTDVPWSSGSPKGIGKYVVSDKSFLFALQSPPTPSNGASPSSCSSPSQQQQCVLPARFNVKKPTFAVVHHGSYGPVFGAGADMFLSDGCHANEDSYSNMPHSYDGPGASSAVLFGDYNFTVLEYEVFTPKS